VIGGFVVAYQRGWVDPLRDASTRSRRQKMALNAKRAAL